jgi:hypothetical protein
MSTYEQLLNSDFQLALREGDMFFQGEGAVQKTLHKITQRLAEINVDYAVAGGMALYKHGFRRYTEDVDILVTPDGLATLHEALDGLGYVRPFAASKNLRDTETGVRIDFIISGQYPGDGKPGPVAFPIPHEVAARYDNMQIVSLERLIELKLASGKAPGRRKDLGDVQELIKMLDLPLALDAKIDESVRPLYDELWHEVHPEASE